MASKIVLLALLPACAFAFFVPGSIHLPEDVYKNMEVDLPTNARCDSYLFQQAQLSFNEKADIKPEALSWKDAPTLIKEVLSRLTEGPINSVTGFLNVCQARTQFLQNMTTVWDACINRYYLLSQIKDNSTSISYPFIYVQLWKHLEFVCNAGLDVVLSVTYPHRLLDLPSYSPYHTCEQAFRDDLEKNPDTLCPSTQTFMDCANKALDKKINHNLAEGWFACEEIRVGYADFCPHLRCYALKQ